MRNNSTLYKIISFTGQQVIKVVEGILSTFIREKGAVLDPKSFYWTSGLEQNAGLIIKDLHNILLDYSSIPNFDDLSPEQKRIVAGEKRWKSFVLYMYGKPIGNNLMRCPDTERLLQTIPGMTSAFFSILEPHTSITPHRGPYKGVLRYHLGLMIPSPPDICGIRIGSDTYHWQAGCSLIFDDTVTHEAWNNSDEIRVVLFVDFKRSYPFPVNIFNDLMIDLIRLSPFIAGIIGRIEKGG
ncbi:MAG: aspH [Bacteroidetes bacterium]|nr:aspH [Bacteroidota bacterium]